jgi:uncharacterized protein
MSFLLDVNVLIALAWPRHVHHHPATRWFSDSHSEGWATTPITESGFIRVSSNPRVFPDGVTPGQAAGLLTRMCAIPGHEFWLDSVSFAETPEEVLLHVHGSSTVTDAHLSLLCRSHAGTLATFDAQAARLAQALGGTSVLIPE